MWWSLGDITGVGNAGVYCICCMWYVFSAEVVVNSSTTKISLSLV